MEAPKYFQEMIAFLPTTKEELEQKVIEINSSIKEINNSKKRLSSDDIENVSDAYQFNLEANYELSELKDTLKCVEYALFLLNGA